MEATRQSVSAELSRAIVQCTREYTGRGPTKARTTITDDMVVTRMEDTLTKGERSLVDSGKRDMVIEIRRCFQVTMREAMVERVEALTGRKVVALMSDNHIEPDMAVEIFVLEPLLPADGNGSLPSEGAG